MMVDEGEMVERKDGMEKIVEKGQDRGRCDESGFRQEGGAA